MYYTKEKSGTWSGHTATHVLGFSFATLTATAPVILCAPKVSIPPPLHSPVG